MELVSALINWYKINYRNLPWRKKTDSYSVWLSEIILQQTQIKQGTLYYQRFIKRFPDIFSLAAATEEEILKEWQGLGYYSRARNMHKTARIISESYNGKFPADFTQLLKLPGIGPYTAAAIASFSFGLPHPVLDGNVYRLISRLYGIKTAVNSPSARSVFMPVLEKIIPHHEAGLFNNAIMELGSLVCKPLKPNCENCPLTEYCAAFKQDLQSELPVKTKKNDVYPRFFNYFLINTNEGVMVVKRIQKDIWMGLYELPLIETSGIVGRNTLTNLLFKNYGIKLNNNRPPKLLESIRHNLSHQQIHARIWGPITDDSIISKQANHRFVLKKEMQTLPTHKILIKYFNEKK